MRRPLLNRQLIQRTNSRCTGFIYISIRNKLVIAVYWPLSVCHVEILNRQWSTTSRAITISFPSILQINKTLPHLTGPRWSGVEDLRLHVRWQVGVDGKDQQLCYLRSQPPASFLEQLATRFDLLLPDTHTHGGRGRRVNQHTRINNKKFPFAAKSVSEYWWNNVT